MLGRSTRGTWELPGGKTNGQESFEQAAVRELAEETGLSASASDTYAVTMLVDDSHGVPRLTAVIRITTWSGTLTNPEKRLFERWEWHDLHALACVGDVVTPAAQFPAKFLCSDPQAAPDVREQVRLSARVGTAEHQRWRGSFTAIEFPAACLAGPARGQTFWRKIRVPQRTGRSIVARMNVTGRSIIATARATSSPVAAV
nr:NUDIX hydrolase [Streptomyces olivochromogenes]